MEHFAGKYRIASSRLRGWDYASDGAYFVTICTADRKHFFGEIVDSRMQFSDMGRLAETHWRAIPQHFPFAALDAFVFMPDHMHGIIILGDIVIPNDEFDTLDDEIIASDDPFVAPDDRRDAINRVSTHPSKTIPSSKTVCASKSFQPKKTTIGTNKKPVGGVVGRFNPMTTHGSLPKIIRWFKGRTSFDAQQLFPDIGFQWQPRFHDHIARNENDLACIRRYIHQNPAQWKSQEKFCREEDIPRGS